jgi:transcription elongation factor Elf1
MSHPFKAIIDVIREANVSTPLYECVRCGDYLPSSQLVDAPGVEGTVDCCHGCYPQYMADRSWE